MNKRIVNMGDRKLRYSIRKYAKGVCSVLLGIWIWMISLSQTVSADDITNNLDSINAVEIVAIENDTNVASDVSVAVDGSEEVLEVEDSGQESDSFNEEELSIDSNVSSLFDNSTDDNQFLDNVEESANDEWTEFNSIESIVENQIDTIEISSGVPVDEEIAEAFGDKSEIDIVVVTTPSRVKALSATSTCVIGDDYPYSTVWEIDKWGLYTGECTLFVAWRLSSVNGFEIPRAFGNASEWGTNASALGYAVNMTPAVGSVAWISSGHVAWVASVSGDNVVIEEYNWNGDHAYHTGMYAKTHYNGFIHFKDISSGSQSGGGTTLPSSGTYTFTSTVDVKDAPKVSANTVAIYSAGQSVIMIAR